MRWLHAVLLTTGLCTVGCATTQELDHTVDDQSAAGIEGKAGQQIAAARGGIEAAESALDAARTELSRQDAAIADAQSRIDAEQAKVDAIREQLEAAEHRLATAEQGHKVQTSRKDTLEKLVEAQQAAVMVAKAKHELSKFKGVAAAQGVAGPLYEQNLAKFQAQVAEQEREYAEAKEDHAASAGETASEQDTYEQMQSDAE